MALFWSVGVVAPLFALSTIFFGILSLIATLFDSTGDTGIVIGRYWSRSLLFLAGTRVKVEGLEKIDPKSHYVFVSNHLSYMDTPVVLSRIPQQFRFWAKKELFSIPFMGTHLKQAGHVAVPLDDPRAALKIMTKTAELMQRRNISVLVFPEGGRSEDGILQPFKDGAAYMAIKAGVPVFPLTLIGTREVLPMHGKIFTPGPVTLRVGDPIPTEGLTLKDRGTVTQQARDQIVRMLEGKSATEVPSSTRAS
jgi:1-acyl-sn-glycerol-3-phosphate acyltransferase